MRISTQLPATASEVSVLSIFLAAFASLFPGQIEVTDLVIWVGAIPHPSLRIAEELPHGEFRMREGILGHLPCLRIKASYHVHVMGVVPEITVQVKTKGIRSGIRTG